MHFFTIWSLSSSWSTKIQMKPRIAIRNEDSEVTRVLMLLVYLKGRSGYGQCCSGATKVLLKGNSLCPHLTRDWDRLTSGSASTSFSTRWKSSLTWTKKMEKKKNPSYISAITVANNNKPTTKKTFFSYNCMQTFCFSPEIETIALQASHHRTSLSCLYRNSWLLKDLWE